MANSNIINAVFGSGLCAVTTSAFRANYGMVLRFSGIELPTAFECDFSNYDTSNNDSVTAIGQNNEVQIPDDLWDSGLNIYAYVYLHPTDDSGVTVYTVTIPVLGRPNRTEETPTPHEQSVIEQAISALNDAVEQTAADVETTTANAQAAAQSEANAATSERSAAASAGAALASQNAAESASQSATESATNASESARNAANSAAQAAQSATNAQEYAEQAEQSAQSIEDDVERAESAAATATEKATAASGSATTASTKATEASASATAAAQSASSASTAAQNAASSSTAAESSATDAEQAKSDAQTAKTAAEQAAESVSGLSAQIAQNTADIAELVLSKAGALIDTATGSIASFVPDATIPTVRGLTVDIEPVQDLHGYDSPWPAGGGKNKFSGRWPVDVIGTYGGWEMPATTYCRLVLYDKGNNADISGVYFGMSETGTETPVTWIVRNGELYSPTYNAANNCYAIGYDNRKYVTIYPATEASLTKIMNRFNVYCFVDDTSATWTYEPYSNICPISGWDSVEVQRTGVNLLNLDADGISRNAYNITKIPNYLKPSTTYTFSINGTTTYTWGLYLSNGGDLAKVLVGQKSAGSSATFTTPADMPQPYLVLTGGSSGAGTETVEVIKPQVELGSSSSAYKPYQGEPITIQLGQTVYGGTLDVTNGVLTVDRAMVDLGTLTWQHGSTRVDGAFRFSAADILIAETADTAHPTAITSQYPLLIQGGTFNATENGFTIGSGKIWIYDEAYKTVTEANFKAAMSGAQLVYTLTTPITIDLTPIEVAVLTGQTNNIWADSGDVSVDYAADLKTYIDQKIAAAVAALS